MTLTHILIFISVSLLIGLIPKYRQMALLVGSVLALYWLQPATPIRNLDFWLPSVTLGLTGVSWALTRKKETEFTRYDWITVITTLALVLAIGLTRLTDFYFTPSRPPQIWQIGIALGWIVAIAFIAERFFKETTWALQLRFWGLIALFVILKYSPFALLAGQGLRTLMGQDPTLATSFDIRWLGFSYIAFRLLHTFRDRLSGRMPDVSLSEYLTFIIFAPALTAGPIDKVERFQKDLQADWRLTSTTTYQAGVRITQGLLMKFVIADSLTYFALNAQNAEQINSTGWMWLATYAYAFRIFFDFAGYTHIAIGLGQLVGIQLPENFRNPYTKPDLTQFWNNWHITLAQWFRSYFFNPLSRFLRGKKWQVWAIIFVGQIGTMLLIALWHGITINFVLWGLWHGLGLFIHNRWATFSKGKWQNLNQRFVDSLGALFTFHFVALGWVWFALPEFSQATHVFAVLLGGK